MNRKLVAKIVFIFMVISLGGALQFVATTFASCPDDIIAYWKLDNNYEDFINGNDGTAIVEPTSDAGIVNTAYLFNGSSTKVDVEADNSFDWKADESFSIEFWVKTDGSSLSENKVVIGRYDGSNNIIWWAGIRKTGKAAFFLRDKDNVGGGVYGDNDTGITVSDGDWHHVMAVRDESTNENILYVDGVEQDRETFDYTGGFDSQTAAINIGYWNYPSTSFYYFDGWIDEIALYDRAIPQDEIDEHYNSGSGTDYCFGSSPFLPFPDNTIALWQLDETTSPPSSRYEDAFNGNYGTGTANLEADDGIVNGAQIFNGSDTGIDIEADNAFDWKADESFSIEFWVKADDDSITENKVAIGRYDGTMVWWAGIRHTGKAAFYLRDTDNVGGGVYGDTDTGTTVSDGSWHLVTAVRDESTNENILYVDGVEENRKTFDYTGGFDSLTAAINIGYWDYPFTSYFYFDGLIDEVALYDRALPQSEIEEHYDAGNLNGEGIVSLRPEPFAQAGSDQTVIETDTVTLDGSGSSDGDGSIVSYLWEQTGGTSVSLTGASSATATFTAPNVNSDGETLTFRLTVTDNDGQQSTDTVQVSVEEQIGPVADAGQNQSVSEGDTVTLDGSDSSDEDGTVDSYLWEQLEGTEVSLNNSDSAIATFTAPNVDEDESCTFQLTVTDNDGLDSVDTIRIDIAADNNDDDDDDSSTSSSGGGGGGGGCFVTSAMF